MENTNLTKNPTELLTLQVENLNKIVQIQLEQVASVREQNEKLNGLMSSISENMDSKGLSQVQVQNFNMPFKALIGLSLKWFLASLVALLIILLVIGVIAGIGFGIFVGIPMLAGV